MSQIPGHVWKATAIAATFGAMLGGVVVLGLRPVIKHKPPPDEEPTVSVRPTVPPSTPLPTADPARRARDINQPLEPISPIAVATPAPVEQIAQIDIADRSGRGDETPIAAWRSYWQDKANGGSGRAYLSRRASGGFSEKGNLDTAFVSVVDNQGYLKLTGNRGPFFVEMRHENGGWRLGQERSSAPQPGRFYLPKTPFDSVSSARPEADTREPYTRLDWQKVEPPQAERQPVQPQVWHARPRKGGEKPRMALTFDACWKTGTRTFDKRIWEILQEKQVPATIFLGGHWMEQFPEETKALASDPLLEFGNHTYLHVHPTHVPPKVLEAELRRTETIFQRLTNRQMAPYYRPPYGEYDTETLETVARCGYVTVHWSVETGDPARSQLARYIINDSLNQAQAGGIVVMHINGQGHHTAEALPQLIDRLRERYELVSLSKL